MNGQAMATQLTELVGQARGNVHLKALSLRLQSNRQPMRQEEPVHIHHEQELFGHDRWASSQA